MAFYSFLVFGRVSEIIASKIGTSFYIMPVVMFLSLVAAALSGELLPMASKRAVRWFVAFNLWVTFVSFPFSIWRGGSFPLVLYQLRMGLIFVAIIGVIRTSKDCHRILSAVALSLLFILFIGFTTPLSDNDQLDRFSFQVGSLSNPNELANHLLIGIPFSSVVLMKGRGLMVKRAIVAVLGIGTVTLLVKTGSRGGILIAIGMVVVMFFSVTFKSKLKMLIAVGLLFCVAVMVVPQSLIVRYATIFSDEGRVEAVQSKESRLELLMASLKITARYPLTGVGPGNFVVKFNDWRTDAGLSGHWEVTHNAFTQVSSEMGIPALTCYLGVFIFTMRELWRLRKNCRRIPELSNIVRMSNVLLLSMFAYLFSGWFTANAHQFYFPVLTALAIVVGKAGNQDLALWNQRKAAQTMDAPVVTPALPRRTPSPRPAFR